MTGPNASQRDLPGEPEGEPDYSTYYCAYEKPSKGQQILMMTLLCLMFMLGIFIMVSGLIEVGEKLESTQTSACPDDSL